MKEKNPELEKIKAVNNQFAKEKKKKQKSRYMNK